MDSLRWGLELGVHLWLPFYSIWNTVATAALWYPSIFVAAIKMIDRLSWTLNAECSMVWFSLYVLVIMNEITKKEQSSLKQKPNSNSNHHLYTCMYVVCTMYTFEGMNIQVKMNDFLMVFPASFSFIFHISFCLPLCIFFSFFILH